MSRYKFLNLNPLGNLEEDCVCRAISLALDEDYYKIKNKLYLVAELFECEMLCVCCYKYLLDEVYGLERLEEYDGLSINEFSKHCPKGVYLIRTDNHLTCMVEGTVFDTWNCTDNEIRLIWKVW